MADVDDQVQHDLEGYFELDAIKLSREECFALDSLGFLLFVAAHRLNALGHLPETLQGLSPSQLSVLRAEAVSIASNVLLADKRNLLPIEVDDGLASSFSLRSRLQPTERPAE